MRRLTACFWCFVTAASAPAQDARPIREQARDLEKHMKQLIDRAEAGVVAVVVSTSPNYPGRFDPSLPGKLGDFAVLPKKFGGPAVGPDPKLDLSDPANIADHNFGSGIVLTAEGLILTNWHLVEGARKIFVRSANGRGSYADITAGDARSDLAVLKLLNPPPDLRPLKLAEGRVDVGRDGEAATITRGQWVISLGHPLAAGFADGSPSASWGIVSNVRRRGVGREREEQRTKPLQQYSVLIQTDARLTLGCSGAPLLNLDGEVIGISVPSAALTGVETAGGYAIPMDPNYRRIIASLKSGREVDYGFLGVSFLPAQFGMPGERFGEGLAVSDVTPGTPAFEAGLRGGDGRFSQNGDVILAVDGRPIRNQDDLFLHVGAALAGTTIRLTINRAGERRTVDVKLAKFYHEFPTISSTKALDVFGIRVDYSSVYLLKIDHRALPKSVLLREIVKDGPAEKKLAALGEAPKGGWLITAVNGEAVGEPAEFYRKTAGKASLRLTLVDPANPAAGRELILP